MNLGNAQQNLGQMEEALRSFDRALVLSTEPAEAHVNRAMILLNNGAFGEGWREYEYRRETPAFGAYKKRRLGKPQWKGEPLEGKRILLYAEQGLGDTIQFARFIPEVLALGAEVFLEVLAPLRELMTQLVDSASILVRGEALPEFDYHCSLLSLPFALKLEFSAIPKQPYLDAPQAVRERVRPGILQAAPRNVLRVGLSWKGNASHRWNRLRSLNLAQLEPLASVPGVQWYVLQKDAAPEEIAALSARIGATMLPSDYLEGFVATAAVIEELDLVVSVDTVTAHLAGALGRPLWLLLPAFYDWRWHSHLPDSPWYPSARLFRQQEPGAWTQAVESLAAELTAVATGNPISLHRHPRNIHG